MDKFDKFRCAWHQCLKKKVGMGGCRTPCSAAMLLASSMILKYLFIPIVFYLLAIAVSSLASAVWLLPCLTFKTAPYFFVGPGFVVGGFIQNKPCAAKRFFAHFHHEVHLIA